jgi:hypothetical protein
VRLTSEEISVVIQALESITIKGKDAPMVANVLKKVGNYFKTTVEKENSK